MEKHPTTEFVIAQDKTSLLKEKIQRIRSLFSVDVKFKRNDATSGQQWICLQGQDEGLQKQAQRYIKSLCSSEPKHALELPLRLCEKLKSGSEGMEVEKLSGAVLSFNGSKVFVQSYDTVLTVMAVSEIERLLAAFREQDDIDTTSAEEKSIVEQDAAIENIPAERSTVGATDIPPSMRELARNLHYTDKAIDAVIKTFGTEINFNQLVGELVKNSASALQLSSASEDTNLLPVARGSCAASPLQPRTLLARGAPATSNRRPEYFVQHVVQPVQSDHLRPIVIDGSNVAMNHGNQRVFSCRGIKLCVEYFQRRGHDDITVFVPMWRTQEFRPESPIRDQEVLDELSNQDVLKLTPSRWTGNRHIVCYDDKYTVELADQNGGIIVSNDNFRDLLKENPRWKETIEQRTLMYTFVGDRFMPPDDPLGRRGPSLDDFLRKGSATHPKICPYLKNCTFGNRCKYYHPERDTQRQQERASARNSPEISAERSTNRTVEPSVTTSSSCATSQATVTTATENHRNISVGDPRVSSFQSRIEPNPRGRPDIRARGGPVPAGAEDPRVSSFQSRIEPNPRARPDIIARGRAIPSGAATYDNTRVPNRDERLYPQGFYPGNVYADYHHPVAPDYAPRNLQYHERPTPMYPPDMSHFPPLHGVPWPSPAYTSQVPYAPPTTMGYPIPTGQSTYVHYYEPAPAPHHNFQGRDQVDSNSQEHSASREQFDNLFKMLKDICEDENKIIRILNNHPQEHDVDKLANLLYEN